ncbi:hypothetical protein NM688_g3432 [Phlebia brevispora]|uniref:Uncharacterized protein n=1 Tax=Phlebia brevispora TaxID=194682 RepID=A0ACC1T5P8_9APHY|nr:hypothetical protein NM688_g3432 [Phlebia brevispora]
MHSDSPKTLATMRASNHVTISYAYAPQALQDRLNTPEPTASYRTHKFSSLAEHHAYDITGVQKISRPHGSYRNVGRWHQEGAP